MKTTNEIEKKEKTIEWYKEALNESEKMHFSYRNMYEREKDNCRKLLLDIKKLRGENCLLKSNEVNTFYKEGENLEEMSVIYKNLFYEMRFYEDGHFVELLEAISSVLSLTEMDSITDEMLTLLRFNSNLTTAIANHAYTLLDSIPIETIKNE
ncbi:MAG: hypothetical protein U0W24_07175 [Bacteroidales bacterium]